MLLRLPPLLLCGDSDGVRRTTRPLPTLFKRP